MVVIFIVGILAAVAIPIMRGRIDAAKWSEGKSAAGSIRTAARAYIAERGNGFDYSGTDLVALGFAVGDLDGRYFIEGDYAVAFTNGAAGNPPTYLVTVTSRKTGEAPSVPTSMTLDNAGTFIEIP
jgi:type II secretory pathway pseudopilin PulG